MMPSIELTPATGALIDALDVGEELPRAAVVGDRRWVVLLDGVPRALVCAGDHEPGVLECFAWARGVSPFVYAQILDAFARKLYGQAPEGVLRWRVPEAATSHRAVLRRMGFGEGTEREGACIYDLTHAAWIAARE